MFKSKKWLVICGAIVFSMSLAVYSQAMDAPDEVTIETLAQYYDAVEFDHAMHMDVADDCSVCHHHTTGTGAVDGRCAKCHTEEVEQDVVACQDCHAKDPFSAENIRLETDTYVYHDDKPGLKAAYHLNCLGCHKEMDGPTGCQDCHGRNEAGDKLFDSGAFAPEPGAHNAHGHN